MITNAEMTEIGEEECLALLAGHSFGRLAVVSDGRPVILPVNYVAEGSVIVFRTDPGLKLDEAPMRPVAFEVDELDPVSGNAWSVLVQGHAFEITRAIDRRSLALRGLMVPSVAPGEREHWLRIEADVITGRRLRAGGTEQ